ncbi:MAG: GntR family transcriptional regulator [Pseudomonadota bacterium]
MSPTDQRPAFALAPGVPEQVADYLQAQIVRGELAPGERIAEARVTEALNVSRGPVREALHRLAARHLVVLEPRRGARVTSFSAEDARGLFDVYGALVTRLAERVAERIAAGHSKPVQVLLADLRARLHAAGDAGDTFEVLAICDTFLQKGAEVVHNVYLGEMLARLAPAFGRAHYLSLAHTTDSTADYIRFVDQLIETVSTGQHADIPRIVSDYARKQIAVIEMIFADAASNS